ncbi:MAG: T9SS type A sorting domain-containing protein [Chlorobi bacterium]|nr:T9SS type A sorting domain-containing protein [Chlorobiota bacterium]
MKKTKGNYAVEFNTSSFTCGVYLYRLKSGNFMETKKLILLYALEVF